MNERVFIELPAVERSTQVKRKLKEIAKRKGYQPKLMALLALERSIIELEKTKHGLPTVEEVAP